MQFFFYIRLYMPTYIHILFIIKICIIHIPNLAAVHFLSSRENLMNDFLRIVSKKYFRRDSDFKKYTQVFGQRERKKCRLFFKSDNFTLSGCELNNCEFIIIKAVMPPSIKFVFRTQLAINRCFKVMN